MANIKNLILIVLMTHCKCAKHTMDPYVIGGNLTNIEAFPHSVYLLMACRAEWICGGSVVNQKIVLTAAHCLSDCNAKLTIIAFAGHADLEKVNVVRTIRRVATHEDYSEMSLTCDIGVALIEGEFPLGDNIKRVVVAPSFLGTLNVAEMAGWGSINEETQESSSILKRVHQYVQTPQDCAVVGLRPPGTFCAKAFSSVDRPAEGDSGSALVLPKPIYQVIGLVSYRIEKYPAIIIYTNVSYHYTWLCQEINQLYCDDEG